MQSRSVKSLMVVLMVALPLALRADCTWMGIPTAASNFITGSDAYDSIREQTFRGCNVRPAPAFFNPQAVVESSYEETLPGL